MPIVLLLLALTQSPPPAADSARTRVDALLAAMGGRAAWARTTFVHVKARHRDPALGLYENEIWNDFASPRVRIEARIDGDRVMRGIENGAGWRVRHGETFALTEAQVESDRAWWEANVYRTLHRLAADDATLTARAVGDNRLEIFRPDGRRLNWFVLNVAGEPILFGTWDDERGTVFGPLVESEGGVRHWRWGTSADGTFQFEISGIEARAAVPAGVSFSSFSGR